jgi:ABC-type Mn2+/Zn2+ transport system ATPase subunit
MPQRSSVDWDFPMTAYDLVMIAFTNGLMKWAKIRQGKVLNALRAERWKNLTSLVSFGGQQQRLFIARALVKDADLFNG